MTDTQAADDAEDAPISDPTDVRFVGPATAAVIEAADFEATAVVEKRVSYDELVAAGTNPGVAARIRREHSLPWTFAGSEGEDLTNRSEQVRGLRDGERAWIAASSGDWESAEPDPATTDGSGDAEAAESAWRDRSSPDPVTDVPGVDGDAATALAEAGITSVRSLATTDPERVAATLSLDPERVADWQAAAEDLLE